MVSSCQVPYTCDELIALKVLITCRIRWRRWWSLRCPLQYKFHKNCVDKHNIIFPKNPCADLSETSGGHPQSAVQLHLIREPPQRIRGDADQNMFEDFLLNLLNFPIRHQLLPILWFRWMTRTDNDHSWDALVILRMDGHHIVVQRYELTTNAIESTKNCFAISICAILQWWLHQRGSAGGVDSFSLQRSWLSLGSAHLSLKT